MRPLALCFLLVFAAFAQGPPAPPPPDGPKQPVSGRIVDAESRQPVRGAQISILHGQSPLASTFSGADGRFLVEAAPAGQWALTVSKSRYQDFYQRVTVPATQPLADLELPIHRYGVITGRVTDHEGLPVTGARVMALTVGFDEGETYLRPHGGRTPFGSQTDDRGEYRIWSLTPGAYRVGVFPEGSPAAAGVVRLKSAGGFYPNGAALGEAEQIRIDWGATREGVDLALKPPAQTRAVIQVAQEGGESGCENCSVGILMEDPQGFVRVANAKPGPGNLILVEGLPAQQYVVSLVGFNLAARTTRHGLATLDLTQAQREPVLLEALSEVAVKGRIVFEDIPEREGETPFRGGLRVQPPRRMFELGMATRRSFARLEISGNEGSFEVDCVPGPVKIELMGSEGYVAGVALDGRPLESSTLTIPPGGIAGDLVVRVRFDTGTVEGSLENLPKSQGSQPLAPEYVLYARPAGKGGVFQSGRYLRVEPDGTFSQPLPPGTYDLIAFPARQGFSPLTDPAGQDAVARMSRRVEVKAGETAAAKVPLIVEP